MSFGVPRRLPLPWTLSSTVLGLWGPRVPFQVALPIITIRGGLLGYVVICAPAWNVSVVDCPCTAGGVHVNGGVLLPPSPRNIVLHTGRCTLYS